MEQTEDRNVSAYIIQLLEENKSINLHDLRLGNGLKWHPKQNVQEKKCIKCMLSKLKMYVLLWIPLRKQKDNHRTRENYCKPFIRIA